MEVFLTDPGQSHVLNTAPLRKTLVHEFAAHKFLRRIGLGLIAAIGYYLGTKLGFLLTPHETLISPLWPPNAIVLAILLLVPKRDWWIPVLAVLPIHLLIQLKLGIPVATSIGWFIGNTGEAVLGAALICRFVHPRRMFESVRGTLIFLAFAVVVAPLATSFWDAATVITTGLGEHFWSLWAARFYSNALAELIVVPIILTFWINGTFWIKEATRVQYMEASALGLGLVTISVLVFDFDRTSSLIYVPLSLFLWAAFRFGSGGLSIAVSTVALISIEGAIQGRGPFASGPIESNVHSLQILLCSVAMPLMLLTAVITERRHIEQSLREVAQKLIGAQEEERQRIGRELHDDIGQQLVILELGLKELKNETIEGQRKPDFEGLIEKAAEVSRSTRELSHGLHPSTLEYLGLQSALQRLCNDVAAKKSLHMKFDAAGLTPPTPPPVALCLYRISQEALQNVVRHSGASEVSLTLVQTKNSIRLRITDNGEGFEVKNVHAGLGLIGMRERLRPLNGAIFISSSSGMGTTLQVKIPLHQPYDTMLSA